MRNCLYILSKSCLIMCPLNLIYLYIPLSQSSTRKIYKIIKLLFIHFSSFNLNIERSDKGNH